MVNEACPNYIAEGRSSCSDISGIDGLNSLMKSEEKVDWCVYSLPMLACADVSLATPDIVYTMLSCFLAQNSPPPQAPLSLFWSKLNPTSRQHVLDTMRVMNSDITPQTQSCFLNADLEVMSADSEIHKPAVVGSYIQHSGFLYNGAQDNAFQCLHSLPMTCQGIVIVASVFNSFYCLYGEATQQQIGVFLAKSVATFSCRSDTMLLTVQTYFKDYAKNMDYSVFQMAFHNADMSSLLSTFSERQLAQYAVLSGALNSPDSAKPISDLLESKNFDFMYKFLLSLPPGNYNSEVVYEFALIILSKQQSDDSSDCKDQVQILFQVKMMFLYTSLNMVMLEKIPLKTCADIKFVFEALDGINDQLNDTQKQDVSKYRYQCLMEQANIAGTGCTYGFSDSSWLIQMVGKSLPYITYPELMSVNKMFNGYKAIELLNTVQTVDLVVYTGLLTNPSPVDAEFCINALIEVFKSKGYGFMERCISSISSQMSSMIANTLVREYFLDGVWNILVVRFAQFTLSDWGMWFNNYLPMCAASISAKQLSYLSVPVVNSCANMQTIMKGLSIPIDSMNSSTAQAVANVAMTFVANSSDHCINENEDWMDVNFYKYTAYISITFIETYNPAYLVNVNLNTFSDSQLGEYLANYEPAQSNVQIVVEIFKILTGGTMEQTEERLNAFWISFNKAPEENFKATLEVKVALLLSTLEALAPRLSAFTGPEAALWFSVNMIRVLDVATPEALSVMPNNVSCDFQMAFVLAASSVNGKADNKSQAAITDYIAKFMTNDKNKPQGENCANKQTSTANYILSYWGEYRGGVTYGEMSKCFNGFNALEVLQLLSAMQIGEMLVEANVYTNVAQMTIVLNFMMDQSISYVNGVMTSFTQTCIEKNILSLPSEVGVLMLSTYLKMISGDLLTYSAEEIGILLATRLYILMPNFKADTLAAIPMKDCNTLNSFVTEMDTSIKRLDVNTCLAIATYITGTLQTTSLDGCKSDSSDSDVWADKNFKLFFPYADLQVIQTFYPLNMTQVMTKTSVSQKVDYLFSSGALASVESTVFVLSTLKTDSTTTTIPRIIDFCNQFNIAYSATNAMRMTPEVRSAAAEILMSVLLSNMNLLNADQIKQLPETCKNFVGGISASIVMKTTYSDNCNTYYAIIATFSEGYGEMSGDVLMAVHNWILFAIESASASSGSSTAFCSSLYTDSTSYLINVYGKFTPQMSFYELSMPFPMFKPLTCMDLMSGTQLGVLLMNTSAINNELEAAQVVLQLQGRPYEEVKQCMSEVHRLATKTSIKLPNSNVATLVGSFAWSIIVTQLNVPIECQYWFFTGGSLFLPYISPIQIGMLSQVTTCDVQRIVVSAFSLNFAGMSADQISAMSAQIKIFSLEILKTTGAPCPAEVWLRDMLGGFSVTFSYLELTTMNPDFNLMIVLNEMSGTQLAQYVLQSRSLSNLTTMATVLYNIDNPKQMGEFLTQLNTAAEVLLQYKEAGMLILQRAFALNVDYFGSFSPDDYKTFCKQTQNCMQYITAVDMQKLPVPMGCESYQTFLSTLNGNFDRMSPETQLMVCHNFIEPQMNSSASTSGVKCGKPSDSLDMWMMNNLGKFYAYISVSMMKMWNVYYNALHVVSTLSPAQAAEACMMVLNDEPKACQLSSRVEEFNVDQMLEFVGLLSTSISEMKPQIDDKAPLQKIVSAVFKMISSSSVKLSAEQMNTFVKIILPLISVIEPENLAILFNFCNCDSYASTIKAMSDNFDKYSDNEKQGLFKVMIVYINNNMKPTGFCPMEGESSSAAVKRIFGDFGKFAQYEQLTAIITALSWTESDLKLTAPQLAHLPLSVYSDDAQVTILNIKLAQLSASDMMLYLENFHTFTSMNKIMAIPMSAQLKLFPTITGTLSALYQTLTPEQWNALWNFVMLFLPSLQDFQIIQIPDTTSCGSLKAIVSAFSSHFEQMTNVTQMACVDKIQTILQTRKSMSGSACFNDVPSSQMWVDDYWGNFFELMELPFLFELNPNFNVMDVIPSCTPEQLAEYMADPSVLANSKSVDIIMRAISGPDMIYFLMAFNEAQKQKGITSIPDPKIRDMMLELVICAISNMLPTYTQENYYILFINIPYLIPSMTEKFFVLLPLSISCDSLATIMEVMKSAPYVRDPPALVNFMNLRLAENQKNTGNACTVGYNSKGWAVAHYGQWLNLVPYDTCTNLFSGFDAASCADMLSSAQLASACLSPGVMYNSTAMTFLLSAASKDVESLQIFMITVKKGLTSDSSFLSLAARQTMLTYASQVAFTKFALMALSDVQAFMDSISFLISIVNSTYLSHIPTTISCDCLAVLVSSLDPIKADYSLQTMKGISDVIFTILKAKSSEGACTNGLNMLDWILKYCGTYVVFNIGAVRIFYSGLSSEDFYSVMNTIRLINPIISSVPFNSSSSSFEVSSS